jgi:hypothetical protein
LALSCLSLHRQGAKASIVATVMRFCRRKRRRKCNFKVRKKEKADKNENIEKKERKVGQHVI